MFSIEQEDSGWVSNFVMSDRGRTTEFLTPIAVRS